MKNLSVEVKWSVTYWQISLQIMVCGLIPLGSWRCWKEAENGNVQGAQTKILELRLTIVKLKFLEQRVPQPGKSAFYVKNLRKNANEMHDQLLRRAVHQSEVCVEMKSINLFFWISDTSLSWIFSERDSQTAISFVEYIVLYCVGSVWIGPQSCPKSGSCANTLSVN